MSKAIYRTWEHFREELYSGMKVDETVGISDRMLYHHHDYRIKVVMFEKAADGSLSWQNIIQEDGVERRSCGSFATIHEAYYDARTALAYYLMFGAFDYLGLEDAVTHGVK